MAKPSSKRFVSILLSMFFILAAIVGYSLFVVPALQEAKLLRGEMDAKEQFYDDQRLAIERIKAWLSQFEENAQLQEAMNSILPVGDSRQSLLVAQVSGLAALKAVFAGRAGERFSGFKWVGFGQSFYACRAY